MARYIYEWKPTEHGRRLFRRPSVGGAAAPAPAAPEPAPEPEPEIETFESETSDYGALLKADLVEVAEERGIDSSGTKADIIERLEQADGDED